MANRTCDDEVTARWKSQFSKNIQSQNMRISDTQAFPVLDFFSDKNSLTAQSD